MQFMQVASNQVLAPYAKFPYIIREIAKAMDLDPDKVTNSMEEAARQAELFKQNNPQPEGGNAAAGVGGGAPGVPGVADTSGAGGGNIGVGQAPVPGEQGFSGNTGMTGEPPVE